MHQKKIVPNLRNTIIDLVENKGVTLFYVGHNGSFDRIVAATLENLKEEYQDIEFFVVLAYLDLLTKKKDGISKINTKHKTIFPSVMEGVPYRFAINKRNEWMINQADFVVTHITNTFGNSYRLKRKAERKRKIVIEVPFT